MRTEQIWLDDERQKRANELGAALIDVLIERAREESPGVVLHGVALMLSEVLHVLRPKLSGVDVVGSIVSTAENMEQRRYGTELLTSLSVNRKF